VEGERLLEGRLVKPVRLSHRGLPKEVALEEAAATLDGRSITLERPPAPGPVHPLIVDGRPHRVAAVRAGDRTFVWCDGRAYEFEAARGGRPASGSEHHGGLVSPMPGRVRRVLIAAGAAVERGDALLVLEAMKMEHSIRAPRDGVVRRICVTEGELVESGVELVELA
jgi:3-methylcrotonyl-CoA carboxylase alpha subunit